MIGELLMEFPELSIGSYTIAVEKSFPPLCVAGPVSSPSMKS